jgi:SAM-dependent methyltransferase
VNVFDAMGTYWAEIADRNQTERQLSFLKSILGHEGYVLDLACGSGRHMIPLSGEGYCVVGLDISRKLLSIAKKRCPDALVVLGDMRHLPFKEDTFTVVVNLDTSIGYLPSQSDDEASFAEAKKALKENGCFVVDIFNKKQLAHKYLNKEPVTKTIDYPSFFLEQKRTVNTDSTVLCDQWTVRDKKSGKVSAFTHSVRLYDREQLEQMLKKTGYNMQTRYGDYEMQPLTDNSKRVIIVAKTE